MKIDLKNNKKQKYIFYAVCIAFIGGLLPSTLDVLMGGTSSPSKQPEKNISAVQNQNNQTTGNNLPVGNQVATKGLATDASALIMFGEDGSNPFVEIGELTVDMENPHAPVMTAKTALDVASRNLPAIPRPNLPSIPTPGEIKVPERVPGVAAVSKAPAVQGILSSGDGSSMAIMSDGSILQEGDTYRDGRIAWIGGDGIRFDDGTSISYK